MSIQIDQIFTAKAENIWQFLNTPGQGCYIPAYQRPYAWDDENVDRLVDDAITGLNHLTNRSSAISFLGTIIAIHDTNNVTVKPVYQAEVAPRVMTLIDGQQRISTSVMMNVGLHNFIRSGLRRIDKGGDDAFEWLQEQAEVALAELFTTFALDQTTGTPQVYRYYPRVIRAFDDVWSRKGNQALYNSPIARLVWNYIKHWDDKKADDFKYSVVDDDGSQNSKHAPLVEVFKYIQGQLRSITGKKSEARDFPDLQQVVRNENFMKALWNHTPPESVVRFVTEQSEHKLFDVFCSLLRGLIFHKYFNLRMAWTVVTTRSEDDAFDMFEALNTTGEPLTAFETFKPKIIETEGLLNYEGSTVHKNVGRIEQYLEAFKKADERQKATSELLIPMALAETGEKLQKNLSDQRRYLRDYFDSLKTIDEKRDVVGSLANLSALVRTGWSSSEDEPSLEAFGKFDHETGFCFQSLRQLKHAVVIGPLSRFYDEFRKSDEEARPHRKLELSQAIKATTAFSMLWRGALGGTENIDSIYRTVMREGSPEDSILPLAKRPKNELGAVSLSGYRRLLLAQFRKRFADRDSWIKSASRIGIYDFSKEVAKFLLIVSNDDAHLDAGQPGLTVRGQKGLSPTIIGTAWNSETNYSIEHIAPQATKPLGWKDELFEEAQTIHRLGNLMLLPGDPNSYLGKRPWEQKRQIYSYLCAKTPEEAEGIKATFGFSVSPPADRLLAKSGYLQNCSAVSLYPDAWNLEIVNQRSLRLSELAYDRIIGWLEV